MKIIAATDSFKGSLTAKKACEIIADVLAEQLPKCSVSIKPMADGGEGTAQAMIAACKGKWISKKVMGPLPDMEVDAGFAWFEDTRTALVEMACASGITLLRSDQLSPLSTTTYGTGQLIAAAMKKQPDEILLAIGGSATNDAGVGAAMALGWEFLDSDQKSIALGGAEIERIETIISPKDISQLNVEVLSDVDNPLCGPNGASCVYAPQKGGDEQTVKRLDLSLDRLAGLIKDQLGIDVLNIPGAGAAGGLGAGAVAFMNGKLVSGVDTMIEVMQLEDEMKDADWIITGEGNLDSQSLQGKVISGITKLAKKTDTKVLVVAGDSHLSSEEYKAFGIDEVLCLKDNNMTTEYAMGNSQSLLEEAIHKFIDSKWK